ncbi:MAG TPA: hypothetical protein VJ894_08025, partial [Cryomorphaceae bacterium]|nr:hypothetical protein [Cryomorphaceae bacterium]
MIDILIYVLEANLYLIMFAVFYFFALRKEKNYLANRFVLISSVILAWTIPSIRFLESVTSALPTIGLEAVTVSPDAMAKTGAFMNFSVQDGLAAIYMLGVI